MLYSSVNNGDGAAGHAPAPHASGAARWKRSEMLKLLCLCAIPAFLLTTFFLPLRASAPSRDELRDALRALDKSAYTQSGCERVDDMLQRCEASQGCDKQFYFTLRNLARNCHGIRCARAGAGRGGGGRARAGRTLLPRGARGGRRGGQRGAGLTLSLPPPSPLPRSTKELERCLLTSPGGKCIFEQLEQFCTADIATILDCHRARMQDLLSRVLSPPLAARAPPLGGAGEAAADGVAAGAGAGAPLDLKAAAAAADDAWRAAGADFWRAAAGAAGDALAGAASDEVSLITWALDEGAAGDVDGARSEAPGAPAGAAAAPPAR